MASINVLVFKSTHCETTTFILKEEDGPELARVYTLKDIASTIREHIKEKKNHPQVNIDCSPDFEITVSYGKKPVHNEALSEEEERQLFQELELQIT